jgi:CHASE2 domain-containing sensor protein
MGKLVVLRLDGELSQQGFRVTLTIKSDGALSSQNNSALHSEIEIEITGYLPPNPILATHLQTHWLQKYRRIGSPYRIKPQEIIYEGSVNNRFRECQESATELQLHFAAWLNSDSFRDIDKGLREELNRDDMIRVLIRTEDEQLQKLPWHLWDFFDRYPEAELALSTTRITQYRTLTLTPSPQVRILAILGHSQGIDINADRRLLENLPNTEAVFLVEPNHEEINDQLWEQPWDIIFFAGHSETAGDTGRIYINQTDSLTINELCYALKKAVSGGLKLAIFNSCDGLGLARKLEDLQIPQMIVMRELVPDQIAQKFLKYFLKAFAGGKSLYLAAREARERLQGLESQFPCASWLPVIFQNPATVPPTWQDLLAPHESLPVKPWQGLQMLLMASLVATCVVMGMRSLGVLQSIELNAFDLMMQLRPAEKPDPRLLIVKVTAEDIQKLGGEYPISDRTLLKLLQKLQSHQPRVIGLDIYRDRPEGTGRVSLIEYLQKNNNIIPICIVPSTKIPQGVAPPSGISSKQLGFGDVIRDSDSIARRHLLAMEPPAAASCSASYALSFQLVFRYLQAEGVSLKFLSEHQWQLGSVVLERLESNNGFYHKKSQLQGFQLLLNYRVAPSPQQIAEQVTLSDILNNQVEPDFIKDKIIIIGVTDPTVEDNFYTPYHQEIRGLLLHAQMVSQLLSAVKDQRSILWFSPLWVEIFWIWLWSVVGGIIAWYSRLLPLNFGIKITGAIISLNGICFVLLLTKGALLPIIPSALTLLTAGGIIIVHRVFQTHRSQ